MIKIFTLGISCICFTSPLFSQKAEKKIDAAAKEVLAQVIEWRRHLHQYPELSNREEKTAAYILEQLQPLGLEIQHPVAHHGIVAVLKGGKPGPVIALRADIDALPIKEEVDIPFKSIQTTQFNGQRVGIMHACGHDAHTAMLLGAAKILSTMRKDIPGTVKFIFQPAEEGVPPGEKGGASLMIEEGALKQPDADVIYGAHISSGLPVGTIGYKPGATLASSANFKITVHGKQAHGARPWQGADPIVIAAQIIVQLQQIVSRETPLTRAPAIISVGKINSGVRHNIVPEEAVLEGTIRLLERDFQDKTFRRIEEIAKGVARSMGGDATVNIIPNNYVTHNDEKLTAHSIRALEKAVGKDNLRLTSWGTAAEDFSHFARQIPGFYFTVGGKPLDLPDEKAPAHHSPEFYIDDSRLDAGVKAFVYLVFNGIPQP